MAKKQDTKAKVAKVKSDARKSDRTKPEKAPAAKVAKIAKAAKSQNARGAVKAVAPAAAAAPAKARKVMKSARATARQLVPSVPSLPKLPSAPRLHAPSMPDLDVSGTVKEIGGQIMSVLNSSAGRVIVAEVLIYLASSLTKAAANTETGKDVTDNVMNAGAKIGAAVASAGARLMETGSAGADKAGDVAGDVAMDAKGIAREVASVAVGAVGGVVAEAASKVMGRRKKSLDAPRNEPFKPAIGGPTQA